MGEAKRRAAQAAVTSLPTTEQLDRISSALRRLATAASSHLGSDCYLHAALAREMFAKLGIPARLTIGFAAWRVGRGPSDTVVHAPAGEQIHLIHDGPGFPYHVWLELGEGQNTRLLDLTTYQLRAKAAEMDKLDGNHTTVEWCPDYLWIPRKMATTLKAVTQSYDSGVCFYEHAEQVARVVTEHAFTLDPEDLSTAWLLYSHPEMQVVGPNDMEV